MSLYRNLALNWKVNLTLVGVFALIVGVFLLILYPFLQNQLDELLEFNKNVLGNLEQVYRNRLIYDLLGESASDESLALTMQDLVLQDPGIRYVRIVDPEGGLFATTESATVDEVLREALVRGAVEREGVLDAPGARAPRVLLRRRSEPTRIIGSGEEAFEFDEDSPPLAEEVARISGAPEFERRQLPEGAALVLTKPLEAAGVPYGVLQIGYSIAAVERSKARTQLIFMGLIASTFIILLLLLNLLISRIVIAPLKSVFRAMRAAGGGDLQQELPVKSGDEFGEMSTIFNRMVRKLRQSKEEIEQYSRNLEKMVSDRTQELRRSEEDVTQLKNYLVTVIESVGTGVLSLDDDGRVTTFNGRAGEILGIDSQSVEGRSMAAVLEDAGLAEIRSFVDRANGAGPGTVDEIDVRLPEGKRTLALRVTPLSDEHGESLGKVVVFDDVTQLIQSKKLLAWKEAVEKVIHEIKNPLTPIRLSTQQLRAAFQDGSPNFGPMFEKGTKTILTSVESLQTLVSDFSFFYRLRPAKLTPTGINSILEDVLGLYSEGLPEGVRLDSDLGPGIPLIQCDAEHVKRVVANLVQNGIDSMEGRTGSVSIRSEYRAERREVCVRVEDEGRGMGAEEMEKIFEPYFTTKIKGTGLGLIISKQIMDEHQGEMRVRSKPDRGTRVELRFPAVPATGSPAPGET